MIVDVTVENFGPYRDRNVFSMQATQGKEHMENIIPADCVKGGVLSSSLIFGPNASGKTFLFKALRALNALVSDAFPENKKYEWYEPFEPEDYFKKSPIFLGIRLIESGIMYDYSVSYTSDSIVGETLLYYPQGRRKTVFRRGGERPVFKGKQKKIVDLLNKSSTFLAVASKYNEDTCALVRDSISSIILLDSDSIVALAGRASDFVKSDPKKKEMLLKGLQKADFGVQDYLVKETILEDSELRNNIPPAIYALIKKEDKDIMTKELYLKHRFKTLRGDDKEVLFDLYRQESVGTRHMFGLMGPLIDVISNGGVIVVDEFGSHLHPMLTRWILEQFKQDKNPKGAQFIAITQDISLMDTQNLVRRDQIFLVNKDRSTGAAEIYCLSDFKGVRMDESILKSYLIGRFDAIPLLSSWSVLDE